MVDHAAPGPAARDFSIFLRVVNGRLIVRVVGELDLVTVPMLDRVLHAHPEHVTIDARDLTFIDAHALGVLVAANSRTGVSVRHARPHCRRVFVVCALGHLLDDGPS
ncbi:MAG TPA: STAS domain-containing protein [Acidimicrobiia bacterium]|nr:STAS domain-containing protein [Acidimicrobiia bacterium]